MSKSKYKEKDKPAVPKARNDAYVMMLFITFLAIVAGCVLMYLDHQEYGGQQPPKLPTPTASKLGESDGKAAAILELHEQAASEDFVVQDSSLSLVRQHTRTNGWQLLLVLLIHILLETKAAFQSTAPT